MYMPIYTMRTMSDEHHALRLPRTLWARYGAVVGDLGRTADLKVYMDWLADNPHVILADDVPGPHDFLATFRVETARWELFTAAIGDSDYAPWVRRYINWRVQNPAQPLPGRRLGPLRRNRRSLACV